LIGGLEGLGISFLVGYILYLIQVWILTKIKYGFSFQFSFVKISILQLSLGATAFLIMRLLPNPWTYISGSIFILISSLYSYRELEKRIGLKEILIHHTQKFRKK